MKNNSAVLYKTRNGAEGNDSRKLRLSHTRANRNNVSIASSIFYDARGSGGFIVLLPDACHKNASIRQELQFETSAKLAR